MIDYFYPDLSNSKDENQKKKFVNELLNPEQAYFEAVQKAANMKKSKNDIIERNNGKNLTNDGREMLNENK
jgi:hypothetical protein